jgi:hypothetical protein
MLRELGRLILPSIFRRKKKKTKEEPVKKTDLEELCADDKETYDALFSVMFLDPRKIHVPMKQAAENAKKSEKEKDFVSARMWYEVAGGLAIYEGNVKKVIEYYGAAERVTGKKYPILKNPEKAVAKAQEYYKKYLQT